MIRKEVREVLDYLDNVFMTASPNVATDLWDILSGLRGPDKGPDSYPLKTAITSVIRAAAFPRVAAESNDCGGPLRAAMVKDRDQLVTVRIERTRDTHFYIHSIAAFNALGLDWNHENKF